MSDFGELCPLFNTGVFNEVTFPQIFMTDICVCGNALIGTITGASATKPGVWTFGRTVVVTGAFIRARLKPAASITIQLWHFTTQLAAGTAFASRIISTTIGNAETYCYIPMNMINAQTFTSSEVLGIAPAESTAANGGCYDFIVRYQEK
jgi:hypothetical protein